MNLDDLATGKGLENESGNEEESPETKNRIYDYLRGMPARELAFYVKTGTEREKIIYAAFLETQSGEYKKEFNEASADPDLGERDDDDFAVDEW